jgi:hypothetical protein
VAAAVAAALGASALPANANHSWGGYHWARQSSSSFTLKVGNNVSSGWASYLDTTISDWSKSNVLDMTKVAGSTRPKNCRPTAGRVEVCNASYGNNGWLGVAQIWITGKHITQGTVKLNDYYFQFASYNNINERQHVICQEVGHTIGLGHTSEDGSSQNTCMDYYHNTSDTDTKSTHPNQHDYDQLASIYNHTDSTTTVDQSTASQAQSRRETTNVSREGNQTVIEFILWA